MKSCLLCLMLSIVFSCVSDARGDLFTIDVSGDRYVKKTNSGTPTVEPEDSGGLSVGKIGNSVPLAIATSVGILPFELPTIPVGHIIVGANLSFSANKFNSLVAPLVDLYGLDSRSSNAVLATDYYHNPVMHDPDAALIQEAILTSTMMSLATDPAFSSHETDLAADSLLADYLNDQFTDGAVAGDFAFLRFNTDKNQAGTPTLYRIGSSAGSLGAVLSITTAAVPEPSAFLFGTLVSVVSGLRVTRHRRRGNTG